MDLKNKLQIMGFEVVSTASRGKEAIQKAGELNPNVVLMDIVLKGEIDGIEAASKINTLFDIPIIYLTAFADEKTYERAKLTKPYGFLTKPLNHDALRGTIETALYKHSLDIKLAESEEKYRALHESMRDAFASVTMDGQIIEFNDSFREMVGYTEEELYNLKYLDITPKKWHKMETEIVDNQIILQGFSDVYEKEYIRKDGTVFPVELKTFLIRDRAGKPNSMWAIIRDISDRKNMDIALKKNKKQLESLIQLLPVGISIIDKDRNTVVTNNELERILGISNKGFKKRFYDKRTYIRSDGSDFPVDEMPTSIVLNENKDIKDVEIGIIKEDGSKMWTNVSAIPLPFKEWRAVVTTSDITGRKKAEERLEESEARFHSLYKNSFDAIFLTKPDGSILTANPAAQEMFLMSEEDILKEGRDGIIVNDEKLGIALKEREQNGRIKAELTCKRKDGSTFPCELTSNIFTDLEDETKTSMIIRDITERKKLEENLKQTNDYLEKQIKKRTVKLEKYYKSCLESQATLEAFFESSPGILNLEDENFCYINTDAITPTYFGLTRKTIRGKCVKDVAPKFIEDFGPMMQHVIDTDEPNLNVEVKSPVPEKPGQIAYWRASYFPVPLIGDKKGIGIMGVEITDLKETEKALKENEERLKLAQNVANIGSFEWNIQTDVNTWTPKLEAMYGLQQGEFLGTQEAWEKLVYPEDFPCIQKLIKHTLETTEPVEGEWRVIWPDGSIHWLFGRFKAFKDKEGNLLRMIGVNIDITGRKEADETIRNSQNQFNVLIENLQSSVALIDKNGKFVVVNPAFMDMFGLDQESDILNVNNQDWSRWKVYDENYKLLPVDEHPVRKSAITGKSVQNQLVGVRNPGSDELIWILVSTEPILNKDNSINMIICTYHNITGRKKVEKQLKELINELKHSNEELQQFAYVSSHDLQEPLRTIASFTQLMQKRYNGKFDEDADEFMDYIVEAAVRMKQQIQDLLDYSRAATGNEEFKLVDINNLLNQTIKSLNTSIKESNAKITYDELPNVMGDLRQLERIFHNLISNAIKFRKIEEPLKINISAYKSENGYEYVFSIQDNGIGIEEQYVERIFTIFQRLHTMDVYEGTGIGLSIVKRIVERHNGRVWVESEFGVGSTFYFTIPITD